MNTDALTTASAAVANCSVVTFYSECNYLGEVLEMKVKLIA